MSQAPTQLQSTPQTTSALQRAHDRLSEWRSRWIEARRLCEALDAGDRANTSPFLQELKDRCERAENEVLRLQKMEVAWQSAHAAVQQSLLALEDAWLCVERTLRSGRVNPQPKQCPAPHPPARRARTL